jgi:hypothetical protein
MADMLLRAAERQRKVTATVVTRMNVTRDGRQQLSQVVLWTHSRSLEVHVTPIHFLVSLIRFD